MKTAKDPRHKKRQDTIKQLFAESFVGQEEQTEKTKKILTKSKVLDKRIEMAAPTWPVDKLNKIDLAILRLATYELLFEDTPPKVIIDEAVELAKEFGSENSPSFVNGVLGTIYKERESKKDETSKQS